MAVLSAKQRDRLAPSQFALPPDRYPINDAIHARAALSLGAKEHNAGKLSDHDYAVVKRKAEHYLAVHEGTGSHADSVKQ